MKPEEFIIIEKKVSPENRERFADAVKRFIREDAGRAIGNFYCEFNNDYTKIRKVNYV